VAADGKIISVKGRRICYTTVEVLCWCLSYIS